MSNNTARIRPIVISVIVALMLAIAPLPVWADPYRPDWVVLTLIYWAMHVPKTVSVGLAWIAGLVLDVAQGTLLGQHALSLTLIIYITVKFHLQLRVFPLSQLAATVFAMLALYQFILFWINGVAGVYASPETYWGPVISGSLFWPVVTWLLTGLRDLSKAT